MNPPQTKLPAFSFEVFRAFRERGGGPLDLRGRKIALACSGGLDSVALMDVLVSLQSRLGFELAIAHVHHGFSADTDLQSSRDRAREFVRSLAERNGRPFFLIEAEGGRELRSENEMREFRLKAFDSLREKEGFSRVVLAHHADDLLETRLIRLIRGTGGQGLTAMSVVGEKTWRPFLSFPKSRIRKHALERGLTWIEDHSNNDTSYLRNWIRRTWLPLLEEKRPGSTRALARSLDLLTGEIGPRLRPPAEEKTTFTRQEFRGLPLREREMRLARLSRSLDVADFGSSKVAEVLKRLSSLEKSKQKSASFQVGGLLWKIDPREISVTKP